MPLKKLKIHWHLCPRQLTCGWLEGGEKNTRFHISGDSSAGRLSGPHAVACAQQDGCGGSWLLGISNPVIQCCYLYGAS